jgi:hypothetical protein
MSLKSYFTQPKDPTAAANHNEAQRRESYQNRASIATWLLVGLGAVVALISGETFSRVTHGISDTVIIAVYFLVIAAAIMLGLARLNFQHKDRTLAKEGFGTPPNKAWPGAAEAIYTTATLLCFATLLTLVAALAASLAFPAPRDNENTGGSTETPPGCLSVCPSSPPAPSGGVKPPPKSEQPRSPTPRCTDGGGTDPGVKGPASVLGQGSC